MKRLDRKQCKIIAHRGYSAEAPENSLSAFRLASETDFDGIESDVQSTKDHQYLMFHDDEFKRMLGRKGYIRNFMYEVIKEAKLIAGSKIEEYPDEVIPHLNDYLDLCKVTRKIPVIEIKGVKNTANLNDIVEIVQSKGLFKDAIIISFQFDYLYYLRQLYPTLKLQYIIKRKIDQRMIALCRTYRFDLDVNYKRLTEKSIALCHANGIKVNCWTVDDPSVAQRLIDWGVDYLTTNRLR